MVDIGTVIALIKKALGSGGGGGGGITDYDDLTDKPQINGVTLSENKSGYDLGIIDAPSDPSYGDFLIYNGSAWIAQSMSVWQGGNY